MKETLIFLNETGLPVVYRRIPYTLHGDYCGFGVTGLANSRAIKEWFGNDYKRFSYSPYDSYVRRKWDTSSDVFSVEFTFNNFGSIEEMPKIIELCLDYYAKELFMQIGPEYCELVNTLSDYCILNDCELSKVEKEWQNEAIHDILSDIQRLCNRDYSEYVSKRRIQLALQKCLDKGQAEWVFEQCSAYVSGMEAVALTAIAMKGRK